MASPKKGKSNTTATGTSRGWGGKAESVVLPSGVKLAFTEDDQDAILKFLGKRDFSEMVEGAEPGSVYNLTFTDGKKIVNVPPSHKLATIEWAVDCYYYLHLVGKVQGKNAEYSPMKDYEVWKLGVEGEVIQAPEDYLKEKEVTLIPEEIARLNYEKLNYPLRKV